MNRTSILQHLKGRDFEVMDGERVKLSSCEVSFQLTGSEILYVVHRPAEVNILLAPETDYTRRADKIGVSEESKIEHGDFDERYVIRDPEETAKRFLNEERLAVVESLEPFVELEFSRKQYRLLKPLSHPDEVERDLHALDKLVKLSETD